MASSRGEPYAQPGSAAGGILDRHRPAVLLGDLLDHREAQPEPTGVAGPAVVEPGEPVEHPLAVVEGDARPVVVDDELDRVVLAGAQLDRDRAGGVAGRVVEQGAPDPPQLLPAARHPRA